MDTLITTEDATLVDASYEVSWASIAAGAVTAAALTLTLLSLGAGLGLSSVSPWSDAGVSTSTFKYTSGAYLVIVAVMSSAIGGYLAARLRTQSSGLHTNEVFFRDTAHGFIAWAFATVLAASVLGAAATHIVSGTTAGGGQAVQNVNPAQVYVDRLLRSDMTPPTDAGAAANNAARNELVRLWTSSFRTDSDLSAADRAYVARVVAARTGMSPADSEKRVDAVVSEAKADADRARSAAASLAFWVTAALIFGAFAASLAAVEGGQLRDGTWEGRRLVPRAW